MTIGGAAHLVRVLTPDAIGRLKKEQRTKGGVTSVREYGYDSEGRLNRQSDDGVATHTWVFDVDGHRTTADGVVSTWDAVGRQATMGAATFSWDVNGNLVTRGDGTTYAFDGDNHLVKVVKGTVVIEYLYDARGRRVARKKNGVVTTGWLYDSSWRVVAEVDAGGATTRRYVYATLANSPDFVETKGKTYALVRDERGSVLEAIDTVSGAVVEAFDYGAWGERTTVASADISSLGYAGGVFDADTGLTHFGARDYSPTLGAWLSPEPMFQNSRFVAATVRHGALPQVYVYAANNPFRNLDPKGLWVIGIGVQAAAQFFLGGELDIQVVIDGHGSVGLQITPAARIGVDLALGVNPMGSWSWDADNIGDLTGPAIFVAADLGPVSGAATASINTSKDVFSNAACRPGESDNRTQNGIQVSGGGPGAGLGITLGAGYTFMPLSGSPFR